MTDAERALTRHFVRHFLDVGFMTSDGSEGVRRALLGAMSAVVTIGLFLPRLIGLQQASAIMMLGDKIDAERAERMGMIYKQFDNNAFEEESMKIADQLSEMPTRGLWLTKQALNRSMGNDMAAQLQLEDQLQLQAASTKDYNEGVAAFIEKRKPKFTGE